MQLVELFLFQWKCILIIKSGKICGSEKTVMEREHVTFSSLQLLTTWNCADPWPVTGHPQNTFGHVCCISGCFNFMSWIGMYSCSASWDTLIPFCECGFWETKPEVLQGSPALLSSLLPSSETVSCLSPEGWCWVGPACVWKYGPYLPLCQWYLLTLVSVASPLHPLLVCLAKDDLVEPKWRNMVFGERQGWSQTASVFLRDGNCSMVGYHGASTVWLLQFDLFWQS